MPTTKELRELYLNMTKENEHQALVFLSKHLKHQYYLLDEEGFNIYLYYGLGNAVAYYENRNTGNTFLDFIGVTDARLELLVFIARIMQLFGHDLVPFESNMIGEADNLFSEFDIF